MQVLSISENVLFVISGFGTLQGIILALIIYFHPRSDKSVNIYLALFILGLSLFAITPLIQHLFTWQKSFYTQPFPLLAAPALYLYVRSFKESVSWRETLLHLIPFFVAFPIFYWFLEYMAARFPDHKQVPAEGLYDPRAITLGLSRLAQNFIYYFLARKTLHVYRLSIKHLFSETSRIDLGWIRWLLNGYLIFIISCVIMYSLMLQYPQYFLFWFLILAAILTPYIYMATFKGITQPTLWQLKPGMNQDVYKNELQEAGIIELKKENEEKSKPQKSGSSELRIRELADKIIAAMERDKLYRESELTLQDLAEKLQSPAHQVSQAINEGLKRNFYDVINSYRVEEAKKLLQDPSNRHFTILSIGFEAGFNSKTTFNTVFKKFTGVTPTEYRDREKMSVAV